MSDTLLVIGAVSLHAGTGLMLAWLSMRVWQREDSVSLAARLMFPWNSHETCVGTPASYSPCGECLRAGKGYVAAYAAIMMVGWPFKLGLCLLTWGFVRFFYRS